MSKSEREGKQETLKNNVAWIYGRNQEETKHDPDKRRFVPSKKFVDVDAIRTFEGEFECLDPAFPCPVHLADELFGGKHKIPYPSYEHALQATRVSQGPKRDEIRNASTAREAKKLASKAGSATGAEWKGRCVQLARSILRDKFIRNKELKKALMQTSHQNILYTPSFGDLFWGLDQNGKGQNQYGKILESIRAEIKEGEDLDNWIKDYCSLMKKDTIDINVIVEKEKMNIKEECKNFAQRNLIFIGKDDDMDIIASHGSISRMHSFVFGDDRAGLCIVDMSSANGTKIRENENDTTPLLPFIPYSITDSTSVFLGASTRTYFFHLDKEAFERRRQELYSRVAGGNDDNRTTSGDGDDSLTVFVGNLLPGVTEQDLRKFFDGCGGIKKLSIPLDRVTQQQRGIAFVTFEDSTALLQAVARDKDVLLGKEIRVKRSSDTNKTGNSNRNGLSSAGDKICFAFQKGNCTRGDSCRYSHTHSKKAENGDQNGYYGRNGRGDDENRSSRLDITETHQRRRERSFSSSSSSSRGSDKRRSKGRNRGRYDEESNSNREIIGRGRSRRDSSGSRSRSRSRSRYRSRSRGRR